MKTRSRIALLALAAPLGLVWSGTLLFLPFSLDVSGDVRKHVAVDERGRMTIAGIGPGTPATEGIEEFLNYQRVRADFGTTAAIVGNTVDGRVGYVLLAYEGNPLAITRLAARWREIFARAGADCDLTRCRLRGHGEDDAVTATFESELGWYGPDGVTVYLQPG